MGWVKMNLCNNNEGVKGLIIAGNIHDMGRILGLLRAFGGALHDPHQVAHDAV